MFENVQGCSSWKMMLTFLAWMSGWSQVHREEGRLPSQVEEVGWDAWMMLT